ncbi:hypothetical protein K8I28_06275 [bacterium]|nr:hypothetical protein [bacterium]
MNLTRPRYLPPNVSQCSVPLLPETSWAQLFQQLYDKWGDPYWWPGDNAWEVAVGAILTQNTNWTNVEKALGNLRERQLHSSDAIISVDINTLAECIKPSGYFNMKAKKLKILAKWWKDAVEKGNILELKPDEVRNELIALWGVGPETADSIACYAFGLPIFPVDAYTQRIYSRLHNLDNIPKYHKIQEEVHTSLPADTLLFNYLHGLLVVLAKQHCVAKNPLCDGCPALSLCQTGQQ